MATNWRMLPPADIVRQTLLVNGRKYTCASGSSLDVPDFDAVVLRANGWTVTGLVGTTAQRPAALPQGISTYVDTTLNKTIHFDGNAFRVHDGTAA